MIEFIDYMWGMDWFGISDWGFTVGHGVFAVGCVRAGYARNGVGSDGIVAARAFLIMFVIRNEYGGGFGGVVRKLDDRGLISVRKR